MMGRNILKGNRGLSLIEMLIVLVLTSIVMGATYQTFLSQQRTYAVQEEVTEMQQNLRATIDRMAREIRMAGYGGDILATFGNVNTFTEIVTPVNATPSDTLTVLLAMEVGKLSQNAAAGTNQLQIGLTDAFDTDKKKYLCLNGQNNYLVQNAAGNSVTLATPLSEDHLINEPVYLVKAITYRAPAHTKDLIRDENTGEGGQVVANNIESLQFQYILSDGSISDAPATPSEIRMVGISITGRTTVTDSKYPGDGYRRQTVSAAVDLRNMGL